MVNPSGHHTASRLNLEQAQPRNIAHKDPNNISHHIHRIGYHFRNDVVDVACTQLGLTSSGRDRPGHAQSGTLASNAIARRMNAFGSKMGVSMDASNQDPERQKKAAFQTITDLFPKLPEADARAIILRAFEEVW